MYLWALHKFRGISKVIVHLSCISGVVHCSTVIVNIVSLNTCSSQNRNCCIGYLGKEGPKIILWVSFFHMWWKGFEKCHISPVEECRRTILMLGIKRASGPDHGRFLTPKRKEGDPGEQVGGQVSWEKLQFLSLRREQNRQIKLQPL